MACYAFVDFDGVLNTPMTWGKRGAGALEPMRVRVLDDFCKEVGAVVVVSSTWRRLLSDAELRDLLVNAGLTVEMVGTTPLTLERRRFEIVQWMNANAPDGHFVIFDDDRDAEIVGHFVHVEGSQGLTRDHTARAKELLARDGWPADAAIQRVGGRA